MNSQHQLLARLTEEGDSVLARLDMWAEVRADRTFFRYGEDGTTLTFREFGVLTDHIAGNLAQRGIQKGDRISVFTRNQKLATLAMFGAWKAGAIYCPINFGFTSLLLYNQIRDANPKILILDDGMSGVVEEAFASRLNIDGMERVVVACQEGAITHPQSQNGAQIISSAVQDDWSIYLQQAERPDISIHPEDLANIIYTSGTTGPSKGAQQTHRWINQMTYFLRKFLTQDDVVYNDLPLHHIGGAICNVVRAAWVGCEVACWDRFSIAQFWERISSSSASCAILLDVMIPWLMKQPASENDRNNTLNKVNMQPLPQHHNEVARRFGFDLVATGFGQTESGNSLVGYILETDADTETPPDIRKGMSRAEIRSVMESYGATVVLPEQATRKGFMGRPTNFVDAAILDEHDQECPDGVVGELALRPRIPFHLFSGYHGRPEATLKALRNFWFHTGDSARREPDGTFTFIDRMADRIRVRGENFSSFEVEDVFNQHPSIDVCAVFSVPAAEGDEDDVVLYVVLVANATETENSLQRWSEQVLPKFMRPRFIRFVPEMPRTATNKIEKFKLKTLFVATAQGGSFTP